MNVKARFFVSKVECYRSRNGYAQENVTLEPVFDDNKDSPNYSFSQATPCGKIEMTITANGAFGAFKPGGVYDILFTPRILPA